jgi:hypothetical protein
VLDLRVYRTAFLPALVALFVAAFALEDRPAPARSALPADVFSGTRALETLDGLAAAYPRRPAGSAADAAVADAVARSLRAPAEAEGRPGFSVRRQFTDGRTATGRGRLETVVATRVGLSSRRIVVLAHRDGTGRASLSATAALIELGRVVKAGALEKTLVLVSTSGGTTGFGGARAWAKTQSGEPVDAVIVLGDLGGTQGRRPWIVAWPGDAGAPALTLQRTLQSAVRTETGRNPGAPRAIAQWLRRAVPITVSEQGALPGLPAVLLSQSGERGPAANEPVRRTRLQAFGRSVLRAVDAIDTARPELRRGSSGVVTLRNVLPDWSVRLVVGSLLLPALLVALDGFFRARRRRVAVLPGLRRLAVVALPVLVAWLWLRLLGATGAFAAPDGPVLPDAFPLHTSGIVALVSAALLAALAGALVHLATRRARPATPGLGMAVGVLICATAAVAWVLNPYAAALLVPAAHLWLFAADGRRTRIAVAALLLGLVLPALVAGYYGVAFGIGPLGLARGAALAAAAGDGLGTTLLLAALLAALAGLARVIVARRGDETSAAPAIRTRGPLSYAGPGSLGGTESALRR